MLGYKVAEVQSEFYYCCMKNSLIGLGLKYIHIPKSLKAKIFGAKKFFPKNLICSFLKLLRDMDNFQMLHIGENNFKSLQLWTFHCLRFKELLDETRSKFTEFC